MTEATKRGFTVIARNLPPHFTQEQLKETFSHYGPVVSTKILPPNDNFPGAYGFINYQDQESCHRAVEQMNNITIDQFTLHVSLGTTRHADAKTDSLPSRSQNELSTSNPSISSAFKRVNSKLANSPFQPKAVINGNRSGSNVSETEKSHASRSSPSPALPVFSSRPVSITIAPHKDFIVNQTYDVYLSSHKVPNVVFVTTLDDYVNATLLMQMMNKVEKNGEIKSNLYNAKLQVGEICAAMYLKKWYRARVIEVEESRVFVQFIDWGNTHRCDPVLETRPLPVEFSTEPELCVKCILDGVPSNDRLTENQKKMIGDLLELDVKFQMTVLRIEDQIPYIQLSRHGRNLNEEIRQVITPVLNRLIPLITLETNQPEVNPNESHNVQITHFDAQTQCFHALLLRESLVTVYNKLKLAAEKRFTSKDQIKLGSLVCAQHEEDELWYRGWIRSVGERGCRVYFVDFGNEEMIPFDRLSECPEVLRTIPWLSVSIQLKNFPIDEDERDELWRQFRKNERLTMKVLEQKKHMFLVDLIANEKSLTEVLDEYRKKKPPPTPPPSVASRPQSAVAKQFSTRTPTTVIKNLPTPETPNYAATNEQFKEMLAEQKKQTKLLERILSAINTSNSLLNQLVQREPPSTD